MCPLTTLLCHWVRRIPQTARWKEISPKLWRLLAGNPNQRCCSLLYHDFSLIHFPDQSKSNSFMRTRFNFTFSISRSLLISFLFLLPLLQSILHMVSWFRVILDEAHMIKDRSTSTAKAVFNLNSLNKWCLSGTPLQNRVGELYSLVRFLRVDPHAFYYCKRKDCNCKSLHYR